MYVPIHLMQYYNTLEIRIVLFVIFRSLSCHSVKHDLHTDSSGVLFVTFVL